ncbi:hypothetical protein T01_16204 [Trichinella spiralis]|uniref:Transmembrane protein n=1 Tax=Trichinella spiralis TaxID=6334 RepID=A0A0V1BIK5_TRISP|nr:hypothetical protein T01_16204 [Trichinella spiralis]
MRKIRLEEDGLLKMVNNCGKLFFLLNASELLFLHSNFIIIIWHFAFESAIKIFFNLICSRYAEAFMDVIVTCRWWICDEFPGYWLMMPKRMSPASRENAR